jgi:hypothetical protein
MSAKYIWILGLLGSGLTVGYVLGKHSSPDASNPECARKYLAMYGRWTRLDATRGNITLQAGNRMYAYSTGDPAVSAHELSAAAMLKTPMPHRDMDKDFEKLVGLTVASTGSASILSTIVQGAAGTGSVARYSKGEAAVALIVTGGSIGVGYWLGHSAQPDFGERKFQETLTNDVGLWTGYDSDWRTEYTRLVDSRIADESRRFAMQSASSIDALYQLQPHQDICSYADGPMWDTSPAGVERAAVRALHPELCNQVDSDPRLLAVIKEEQSRPPARTASQQSLAFSLSEYYSGTGKYSKPLATSPRKGQPKQPLVLPAPPPALAPQ